MKLLAIRVSEDFRKSLQMHLAKNDLSLQAYIMTLITNDMANHTETAQESPILTSTMVLKWLKKHLEQ